MLFYKPHEEYDNILRKTIIYKDFTQIGTSNNEFWEKEFVCSAIIYLGLLAYFMEIILPKNIMLCILFFGTIILSIPILFYPFERLSGNYLSQITYAA